MTLSGLSILLGLLIAIPSAFVFLKPETAAPVLRKFPRSETWGYVLMAIGAGWFLFNLNREAIAEFANYKKLMLIGFAAVAIAACHFVLDFLAVRGLAICMLMLAWYTLTAFRWADSQWHIVLSIISYIWIIAGMWFMISPWRLRDLIQWATASTGRMRAWSAARMAVGALLIVLGVTAFK
jgi:hypothetical protein